MNYTNENFYTTSYLCGGKPSVITAAFDFYARSATQIIKQYTFDNINESNISDDVKMCCCEVAEMLFIAEQAQSGVVSESVGGWSKSYESTEAKKQALDKAIYDIVYKWLANTGLMYRGV